MQGREKLHYLNPVPIYEVFDRWIRKFEKPRLRALGTSRNSWKGDERDKQPEIHRGHIKAEFVYVTYIQTTAEEAWKALTQGDITPAVLGLREPLGLEARIQLGAPQGRRGSR